MPDNSYQVGASPNYAAGLMNWQDLFGSNNRNLTPDQIKKITSGQTNSGNQSLTPEQIRQVMSGQAGGPPSVQPQMQGPNRIANPPPQPPTPPGLGGYLQRRFGDQGAPPQAGPSDNSWANGWDVNG